jgi:imidazolonepropionase-like amidohydrolase
VALSGLLALGLVLVAVADRGGWFEVVDVEPGTPPAAIPVLAADERAYYDYVAPRLRELSAEARFLGRLGAERSRDLPEIRRHGDRLTALLGEVTAYTRAYGVPARFAATDAAFREGAGLAVRAMAASREGLARFDFARVAEAVPLFDAGAAKLAEASALVEAEGGAFPASPAPGGAPPA